MFDLNFEHLLPLILYAETHYKFKGIYSRLFQTEPEIVADAPFRVEPGRPIPILVLVKDAHRFPIEIQKILIEIKQTDKLIAKRIELELTDPNQKYRVFTRPPIVKDYYQH